MCIRDRLYTFLRQADARELGGLFRELDAAKKAGDAVNTHRILHKIDEFQTHIVPIIADIDAGFGNAEATYLLAKKFIEAGACCIQIENPVSYTHLDVYKRQPADCLWTHLTLGSSRFRPLRTACSWVDLTNSRSSQWGEVCLRNDSIVHSNASESLSKTETSNVKAGGCTRARRRVCFRAICNFAMRSCRTSSAG